MAIRTLNQEGNKITVNLCVAGLLFMSRMYSAMVKLDFQAHASSKPIKLR